MSAPFLFVVRRDMPNRAGSVPMSRLTCSSPSTVRTTGCVDIRRCYDVARRNSGPPPAFGHTATAQPPTLPRNDRARSFRKQDGRRRHAQVDADDAPELAVSEHGGERDEFLAQRGGAADDRPQPAGGRRHRASSPRSRSSPEPSTRAWRRPPAARAGPRPGASSPAHRARRGPRSRRTRRRPATTAAGKRRPRAPVRSRRKRRRSHSCPAPLRRPPESAR